MAGPFSPIIKFAGKLLGQGHDVVPVVRLEGMIAAGGRGNTLNIQKVEKMLDKAFLMKAPAVAIVINSPGGSPVQSKLIHDRIRYLSERFKRPVLVFCEDVAASGGYMIACAGDEIFCDDSSILGSIGVISASFGFVDAMEKLGVERRVRTAGANKSLGDPFRPETKEQKDRLDRLMGEVHESFIEVVKSRRSDKLSDDEDLFTGEVYVGQKAVEAGLADGIAEVRREIRERYGDETELKPFSVQKSGFLARLMGGAMVHAADAIEERSLWARFGL